MNIICAGFGGQGVLTAGLILGKTATETGKYVTWIPSYGSEMRGGTANCSVKISETKIASPFISEIDILIAMNQPSVDKFEEALKAGGLMVVNSSMVRDHRFRKDIRVIRVDATAIAEDSANPRGANLAMLGGLAAGGILMDAETIRAGLNRFFDEKGKNDPKNSLCFDLGMKNARQE
jgi:2-oxoglutarate ferredoxin oxidoreductase subunit gamma